MCYSCVIFLARSRVSLPQETPMLGIQSGVNHDSAIRPIVKIADPTLAEIMSTTLEEATFPALAGASHAIPADATGSTLTDTTRPTLADVARLAGVSSATASRVLTGSAQVRPGTRNQVEAAMARLGYARNRAARTTRAKVSGSVGLVVCEESIRVFTDPFFSRVLWGASQALAPRDLQLVLLTVSSPRDCRRISRYLRSGHVDGVAMVSMHGRQPLDIHSFGIPVVLAGRPPMDDETVSYVDADNAVGAESAVRYLIESGRKTVATVAGPPDMCPGIDRLRGYRKATGDAGLPPLVVYGDFVNPNSAEHATQRLLDVRPGVDAVFAASDLMATGVIRALRKAGRRVPDDVAVIGFDDGPLALHIDPPLTTVRQPIEEIGSRMTRELLAQMGDGSSDPCHVILDTELVHRDSA